MVWTFKRGQRQRDERKGYILQFDPVRTSEEVTSVKEQWKGNGQSIENGRLRATQAEEADGDACRCLCHSHRRCHHTYVLHRWAHIFRMLVQS
jgi:hypothetical protein